MTVYVKKSTDSGAPVLTGSIGSAIALLDYLLVTTMGWTKPYTGTNIAAYKQPAGTNGFYLRVDNSIATSVRIVGYETMSDVNTGTGAFPTAAQFASGLYLPTHSSGSTAPWRFYSNGKIFYLFVQASATNWVSLTFGDLISYKPSDVYGTVLIASDSTGNTNCRFPQVVVSYATGLAAHYLARTAAQTGTAVACTKVSDWVRTNNVNFMGTGGVAYPSPIESGLLMAPVWVAEATIGARGLLPGVWNPLHNVPLADGDSFGGVGNLLGRVFDAQAMTTSASTTGQVFMETSDTWGEP